MAKAQAGRFRTTPGTAARMKIPFFRSRKDKAAAGDAKPALATTSATDNAAAPLPEQAPTARPLAPRPRTRRVPTELVVESLGYAVAAVPSLGPTIRGWRKLGFEVSEPYAWEGCLAAHIDLAAGGLRFLAPDPSQPSSPASALVSSRFVVGSGLVGWTWACAAPHRSALAVGQLGNHDFHAECEAEDDDVVRVPTELTPCAATWLEKPGASPPPAHPNGVSSLDHIVLQVSAARRTAEAYEAHFGLKARSTAMNDRWYAFLKVGPSLLEIVGPQKPPAETGAKAPSTAITGGPWGLAFRSPDLDATVAYLRSAGIQVKDPHRAVQGGRITGMSVPLSGIPLAFLGE